MFGHIDLHPVNRKLECVDMLDLPGVKPPQGKSRSLGFDFLVGSSKLMNIVPMVGLCFGLERLDDEVLCSGFGREEALRTAIGEGVVAPGGWFEEGLVGVDDELHCRWGICFVSIERRKAQN
jgi:hypothetical protein